MSLEEAYQERIEAQLREWNAEIARLKARADIERSQAKIEYYKRVDALQKRLGNNPLDNFFDMLREKFSGDEERQ
jgi:hypothetical protein